MQSIILTRGRPILGYLFLYNCLKKLENLGSPRKAALRYRFFTKFIYANFLGFIQTVHSSNTSKDVEPVPAAVKESGQNVAFYILQSDEYFEVGKYQDSYKVLQYFQESNNPEILWRMARGLYNMSKQKGVKQTEQVQMVEQAYGLVQRALQLDSNNYAVHKWFAILTDAKFTFEGTSARIKALPDFKKHLMRAMELNPKDATVMYILGQYCYNIAGMAWYERKIASAVFGKPPVSTFEEALFYFSKAEEAEPNFYSLNLLMLGKTYIQLKKIEAACYWLRCASSYPIRTDEDKEVRKEAEDLLKKYANAKCDHSSRESFRGHENYKNNE